MIVLTYTVDTTLLDGDGRINPETRSRIAATRYPLLQSGFELGDGSRSLRIIDDPNCDPTEIRVSAGDHKALGLKQAVVQAGPLPGAGDALTDTERAGLLLAAISRSLVGDPDGSAPLLVKLQELALAGRLAALAQAMHEYLSVVPAARPYVIRQLGGIVSSRYLAGHLKLGTGQIARWLHRHEKLYGRLIDVAEPASFQVAMELAALLVELGA